MNRDYAPDMRLDNYSEAGIDDEGDFEDLDIGARREAEAAMARRDRVAGRAGGRRAAARRRAPGFLPSDEDSDIDDRTAGGVLPAGIKRRARRHYDERREIDDAEGADDDDEIPLEHLGDIKANSIAEWVATDGVKKSIEKNFRSFLLTYVDDQGNSVYGERIKNLGERADHFLFF